MQNNNGMKITPSRQDKQISGQFHGSLPRKGKGGNVTGNEVQMKSKVTKRRGMLRDSLGEGMKGVSMGPAKNNKYK